MAGPLGVGVFGRAKLKPPNPVDGGLDVEGDADISSLAAGACWRFRPPLPPVRGTEVICPGSREKVIPEKAENGEGEGAVTVADEVEGETTSFLTLVEGVAEGDLGVGAEGRGSGMSSIRTACFEACENKLDREDEALVIRVLIPLRRPARRAEASSSRAALTAAVISAETGMGARLVGELLLFLGVSKEMY